MNNLTEIEVYILNLFNNTNWYYSDLIGWFQSYDSSPQYFQFVDFHIFKLREKGYLNTYYDNNYRQFFTNNSNSAKIINPNQYHTLNNTSRTELERVIYQNTVLSNEQLIYLKNSREKDELDKGNAFKEQKKSNNISLLNSLLAIFSIGLTFYIYSQSVECDKLKDELKKISEKVKLNNNYPPKIHSTNVKPNSKKNKMNNN